MVPSQSQVASHEVTYQIRVQGWLDPSWSGWLENLQVTHTPAGETLLTGKLTDQAALYGVLKKVRDLGLPLLALQPLSDA